MWPLNAGKMLPKLKIGYPIFRETEQFLLEVWMEVSSETSERHLFYRRDVQRFEAAVDEKKRSGFLVVTSCRCLRDLEKSEDYIHLSLSGAQSGRAPEVSP